MAKFTVEVTVRGTQVIEVEADSVSEASELAREMADPFESEDIEVDVEDCYLSDDEDEDEDFPDYGARFDDDEDDEDDDEYYD